jgi:hypothetical protein
MTPQADALLPFLVPPAIYRGVGVILGETVVLSPEPSGFVCDALQTVDIFTSE